jgi:hypothetical protein
LREQVKKIGGIIGIALIILCIVVACAPKEEAVTLIGGMGL